MPDDPSFFTDFAAEKLRKHNQDIAANAGSNICGTGNGNHIFW